MIWIFFIFFASNAQEIGPNRIPKEEYSLSMDRIDFSKDVYFQSYPHIESDWMGKFAIPLAGELGRKFEIMNIPFNLNLLGFYKLPFLFSGGDYVWRAQLSFPLSD